MRYEKFCMMGSAWTWRYHSFSLEHQEPIKQISDVDPGAKGGAGPVVMPGWRSPDEISVGVMLCRWPLAVGRDVRMEKVKRGQDQP